ncbi:MAG TPA: hypothetical protein VGD59_04285 [Acidisarcina sp.]
MRTTIDIADAIYERSQKVARESGISVEQLIARMLERDLASESAPIKSGNRVSLPLVQSGRPASLDLSSYNFDELLG